MRVSGFKFTFGEEDVFIKTANRAAPQVSEDERAALKSSMGRQDEQYKDLVTNEENREEFVKSFISSKVLAVVIPDQVDAISLLTSSERREADIEKDQIAFKSVTINNSQNYEEFFTDPEFSKHNNTPENPDSQDLSDWDTSSIDNFDWQKQFEDDSQSVHSYTSANGDTVIDPDKLTLIQDKERTFLAEAMVGGIDPTIQNHLVRTDDMKAFVIDHGRDLGNFTSLKITQDAVSLRQDKLIGKFFKDFVERIDEAYDSKLLFDPEKFATTCHDFSKTRDEDIAKAVKSSITELKEARFNFKDLNFRINEQYVSFKSPEEFGELVTLGIINEKRIMAALATALESNIDKVPANKNWQEYFSSSAGQQLLNANVPSLITPDEAKRMYNTAARTQQSRIER